MVNSEYPVCWWQKCHRFWHSKVKSFTIVGLDPSALIRELASMMALTTEPQWTGRFCTMITLLVLFIENRQCLSLSLMKIGDKRVTHIALYQWWVTVKIMASVYSASTMIFIPQISDAWQYPKASTVHVELNILNLGIIIYLPWSGHTKPGLRRQVEGQEP